MNRNEQKLVAPSIVVVLIGALIGACSTPPTFDQVRCDPKSGVWALPECRDAATDSTPETDAGTDADNDADTDAATAVEDSPGLSPGSLPHCNGVCVPEASDTAAGSWINEPLLVWMGPLSEMPANCPPEAPYMKWKRYGDLVAPPAQCETCSCESSGKCTGLPASIEIHSGACNASNVETRPFDGPPNWDGLCTSANAMAAGTLCNGVPCAQSVYASTLPGPTTEACTSTNDKPNATTEYHWNDGALACTATELEGVCEISPESCVQTKPEPWLHCVAARVKKSGVDDTMRNLRRSLRVL